MAQETQYQRILERSGDEVVRPSPRVNASPKCPAARQAPAGPAADAEPLIRLCQLPPTAWKAKVQVRAALARATG